MGMSPMSPKFAPYVLVPILSLRMSYIPKFEFNLMNVSKICEENSCHAVFNSKNCFFKDHLIGKMMGFGSVAQGLHFWISFSDDLKLSSLNNSFFFFCNATTSNKTIIFHQQLGHTALFPHPKCSICPLAKQS